MLISKASGWCSMLASELSHQATLRERGYIARNSRCVSRLQEQVCARLQCVKSAFTNIFAHSSLWRSSHTLAQHRLLVEVDCPACIAWHAALGNKRHWCAWQTARDTGVQKPQPNDQAVFVGLSGKSQGLWAAAELHGRCGKGTRWHFHRRASALLCDPGAGVDHDAQCAVPASQADDGCIQHQSADWSDH